MNKVETEKFCVEAKRANIMYQYYAKEAKKYYQRAKEERQRGNTKSMKYYLKRMKDCYMDFKEKEAVYGALSYAKTCIFNINVIDAYNICKHNKEIIKMQEIFEIGEEGYSVDYSLMNIIKKIMKGGR